ncbi:Hsp20/alpha crystallin family protein [Chryseobacterium sp. A301]
MSNITKPHFLFDDFFTKDWFENERNVKRTSSMPKVNILESDTQYTIQLAAPGLKKEDFKLDFKQGQLSIAREVEETENLSAERYTLQEFTYASFKRNFTLPKSTTKEDIQASYENGILTIAIEKKQPAKIEASQIEIK